MTQIPVKEMTFTKLNVIKTKSIVHKQGLSITWNAIIDALLEVASKHEEDFYSEINKQNGKQRKN